MLSSSSPEPFDSSLMPPAAGEAASSGGPTCESAVGRWDSSDFMLCFSRGDLRSLARYGGLGSNESRRPPLFTPRT